MTQHNASKQCLITIFMAVCLVWVRVCALCASMESVLLCFRCFSVWFYEISQWSLSLSLHTKLPFILLEFGFCVCACCVRVHAAIFLLVYRRRPDQWRLFMQNTRENGDCMTSTRARKGNKNNMRSTAFGAQHNSFTLLPLFCMRFFSLRR